MKQQKQKGQHKMIVVLLLALMVLLVAFGFVYAYKYTDLFRGNESENVMATPSGNEASSDSNSQTESAVSTDIGATVTNPETENSENPTNNETQTDANGVVVSDASTPSVSEGSTPLISAGSTVQKPVVPEKTTEEIVLEKAEEVIEKIEGKPEYKATDLCKAPANPTESGRIVFPIDEKYTKLNFLGQVFTAAKCGDERLFSIWGISGEMYTLGSTLNLSKNPSSELVKSLKDIGFECTEKTSEAECKVWRLSREVRAKSLVILEPFMEYMASDDCFLCG